MMLQVFVNKKILIALLFQR